MKLPKLILASGSPRRSEILTSVGWEFTKLVADIDEVEFQGEDPAAYVQRLAQSKAEKVAQIVENGLILGADTTVVIDNQIIGKPVDIDDARRMLDLLSGREHRVLTGVALVRKLSENKVVGCGRSTEDNETSCRSISGVQTTLVKFRQMTEAEIDYLAKNGDPLDKAGAYAVQAQAALFIEEIQGDYWNVVGLPINLVYQLVKKLEQDENSC